MKTETIAVTTIHSPVRFLKKNKVTTGIISAMENKKNF
jgi:hypothetical protein